MTNDSPHPSPASRANDPLPQIDPVALLMDARLQFFAAIEALGGREPDRVAAALAAVVAHDDALAAVALAWADGARTFEGIPTPVERVRTAAADASAAPTTDDANAARGRLFESLGAGVALDVEVALPWVGTDSWQLHLIGLAMHEGSHAHALREGSPLPPPPGAARPS
jgi:hypothetical protein